MSAPQVLYLQHGGKTTIAKWVRSFFPPHRVYVEPFFGGGAVLLGKAPSDVDVANDIDRSIVNVYRQAIEHPEALAAALRICPYHEGLDVPDDDTVAGAVQAIAAVKQRYAGRRASSSFVDGNGGGRIEAWRRWWTRVAPAVQRLARVTFYCRDAVDVIERYADDPDCLIYADPPYVGHETEYEHRVDYGRLVDVLAHARGYVVVSEYREALTRWPADWPYDERAFTKRNAARNGKGTCDQKTEVVILNPRAAEWVEQRGVA